MCQDHVGPCGIKTVTGLEFVRTGPVAMLVRPTYAYMAYVVDAQAFRYSSGVNGLEC